MVDDLPRQRHDAWSVACVRSSECGAAAVRFALLLGKIGLNGDMCIRGLWSKQNWEGQTDMVFIARLLLAIGLFWVVATATPAMALEPICSSPAVIFCEDWE